MYWIVDRYGGVSSTVLQTAVDGWAVAIGLCLVLAYSCAVAWRRRGGSVKTGEPPLPEPERSPNLEESVLTDEERVLQLLDSNGGRMHQSRIVEATEWSKSKVSMLLSEMEREGQVSKLRVGRENIISQPGFEPRAARSALETGA